MHHLIYIGVGGALGSMLRFIAAQNVQLWLGKGFPYGTLFVNVSGSFAIGVLFVLLTERWDVGPQWRAFFMIGILGGYTTFSSFSLETLNLFMQGEWWKACLNSVMSLVFCVAAAGLGIWLAKQF